MPGFVRIPAFLIAFAMFQSAVITGVAQGPAVEVYSDRPATASGGEGEADPETPVWRVPLELKVTLKAGYDDNRRTRSSDGGASDDGGSFFSSGELLFNYNFGLPRTRGNLTGHAKLNYYPGSNRSPFDPDLGVKLSVQHAVSERLTLTGDVEAKYKIDPDFDIEGSSNQRRGNYFYNRDQISATYRWLPRISTITSYSFDTLQYQETTPGSIGDRYQHRLSQNLRFLLLPTVSLTGTYSLSLVSYDVEGRDSITQSILAGVTSSIGPHLEASLAVGGQFRSADQPGTENSNFSASPTANANLTYTLGEKTSLMWDARYGFVESAVGTGSSGPATSSGTRGRTSFTTGLRLNYELTARIGTSIAAHYRTYASDEVNGAPVDEFATSQNAFDLSLNVHYKINESILTFAEWKYTNVASDQTSGSYSRNRYSLGLTITF